MVFIGVCIYFYSGFNVLIVFVAENLRSRRDLLNPRLGFNAHGARKKLYFPLAVQGRNSVFRNLRPHRFAPPESIPFIPAG
jgi:hypothetical protein